LKSSEQKAIYLFFIVIAMAGLATGLSDGVFSNYFKDAYDVDAFARGVIELPRELPGILCMFLFSALAFLGDIRLSIIAHVLIIAGLMTLGFLTPPFGVMLIFLFVNSLGLHMFMPLGDSLGLSLASAGSFGSILGRFNGVRTAFSMLAGILVFAGFRTGFFSFTTPIKWIFFVAAAGFAVGAVALWRMGRLKQFKKNSTPPKPGAPKLIFRKQYKLFYLLAVLFGARKQIMMVYGPWVLIDLLGFRTDTMALLGIGGAAVGIFFIPAVGRWIDKFGTARIMMIEAAVFLVVYAAYGVLSAGLHGGWLVGAGMVVVLAFAINMADRMTMQFGMVRTVYMRSIALDPDDVTPTLSVGMAMDHVLSVSSALLCGFLWSVWGPQYVFVFAALLSAGNMVVALFIRKGTDRQTA